MIEHQGQIYRIDIKNKEVEVLEKTGAFDFSCEDIHSVTVQNAGNVLAYLNGGWYFPPGSTIQLGAQHDVNGYKDIVRVEFTDVVFSADPANPDPPRPRVQAWPVYAQVCKCNLF